MTILACGMCGGVLEAGALTAIVAGSAGATHIYNRVRLAIHERNEQRKQNHRNSQNHQPRRPKA